MRAQVSSGLQTVSTLPLDVLVKEVGNDIISPSGIDMEVDIVAGIGMDVWHELLGVAEDGPCRLLEDAFAFAVADDIVRLSGDCLSCLELVLSSANITEGVSYQSGTGEVARVKVVASDAGKLSDGEGVLVLFRVGRDRGSVEGVLEVTR
jgi:hypothetical protein